MAYVNPYSYYPTYQPIQPTQQQNPQNASNLIWVQGEAGAKSFLVAPNTTVQLWDSEAQTIYLKSADASGMPSMKILDYVMRDNSQQEVPVETAKNYVTKDEFQLFVEKMQKKIDRLSQKVIKEEDDE